MLMFSFDFLENVPDFIAGIGWVDVALILFLVRGLYRGLDKGFADEFPRLCAIVIASLVTLHFYGFLSEAISTNSFITPPASNVIAFGFLAVVLIFGLRFLFRFFGKVIHVEFKGSVDKFMGVGAGLLRYFLLFALISNFILLFNIPYFRDSYEVRSRSGLLVSKICQSFHDQVFRTIEATVAPVKKAKSK